jgi:tetratricopeptide (TPR) repeat protein
LFLLCLAVEGRAQAAEKWNEPVSEEAKSSYRAALRELRAGRPQAALEKLERAVGMAPHFYRAHEGGALIRINYLGQMRATAEETLARMEAEPTNPIYPLVLSKITFTRGWRQLQDRVLEVAPEWVYADLVRAKQPFFDRQCEKELEYLRRLAAAVPDDHEVWRSLARSLLRLRRYGEAEAAYRKAAELDEHARLLLPYNLWQMELRRAGGTQAAKARLLEKIKQWHQQQPTTLDTLAVL